MMGDDHDVDDADALLTFFYKTWQCQTVTAAAYTQVFTYPRHVRHATFGVRILSRYVSADELRSSFVCASYVLVEYERFTCVLLPATDPYAVLQSLHSFILQSSH